MGKAIETMAHKVFSRKGVLTIERSTDDRFWIVCIKYPEQDDYRQWIFGNSYEPLEKLANKVNGRLR